jgi:DNA repair exonuclease SbcCD nuclease subunit
MQFVHAADLHLSASEAEKSYCLDVLKEIGESATRAKVPLIVFAGDTFDSFTDAMALRASFTDWAASLGADVRVFLIPGNHEDLQKGSNDLSRLSFGPKVSVFTQTPFSVRTLEDAEFLLVPFQKDFYDTTKWQIPPKVVRHRVVVMHGTVAGMVFVGAESDESETAAIDPGLFAKLDADYAALGHIHSSRSETFGKTLVSYPGSARVWRRGEVGPRTILVVDTNNVTRSKQVPLGAAGEFRQVNVHLQLDGTYPELENLGKDWNPNDSVMLVMRGIVEDENTVAQTEAKIQAEVGRRVRVLDFKREVVPVAGIAEKQIARRFLEAWGKREAAKGESPDVLERTRELGLQAIAGLMGVRL